MKQNQEVSDQSIIEVSDLLSLLEINRQLSETILGLIQENTALRNSQKEIILPNAQENTELDHKIDLTKLPGGVSTWDEDRVKFELACLENNTGEQPNESKVTVVRDSP